jgi:hypothetical protein
VFSGCASAESGRGSEEWKGTDAALADSTGPCTRTNLEMTLSRTGGMGREEFSINADAVLAVCHPRYRDDPEDEDDAADSSRAEDDVGAGVGDVDATEDSTSMGAVLDAILPLNVS